MAVIGAPHFGCNVSRGPTTVQWYLTGPATRAKVEG
jgi:hypothetical protein